jgi:hypothetical protein
MDLTTQAINQTDVMRKKKRGKMVAQQGFTASGST